MKINQLFESLDRQQKSVPELPATFQPKKISVLKNKTDPQHPMAGYAVGASESTQTHKGGTVTKTSTGLRHQAGPDTYGGAEPERDNLRVLDKGRTLRIDKELGVKYDREKAWQGGLDIKEDITKEDIITKLKARLGDYLSDLSKEIKKDPDLVDKLAATPPGDQVGPPVKTVTTDDGHQIQIHGNEDDGFRVSIKNKPATTKFESLDHAVMACEMYCARRRGSMADRSLNNDYLDEA